ncbi:carbohydrate ABC transporter permease [Ruminiclostridium cellobioparum]|jgi:putative aldouronate transport system permease protein|uniref:carbohydrate ABC transporter permease n=1 Tax=Ruminiclostridium cellobioparum TaxID=29355 RepID=UPI0028AD8758|nr:carbohydrate ABC transporter permease [Ruminiclostridium cellobioparum]
MRRTREDKIVDIANYVLLFIIGIVTLYPFYYTVICSFNDGMDLLKGGVYFWPRKFTVDSYKVFLGDKSWQTAFFISTARTVVGTVFSVILTCVFSYGLSRKELMFRKFYTFLVVFTMYFSGGLIPYYVLLRNLHLLNSFWVYVIPGMVSSFFTITGINFFRSIPESMIEAARIDGAGELQIFWKVCMPVSLPFIATLSLFVAVGQWNSWLDAAYFVRDENLKTMSYKMMTTINKIMASSSNVNTAGQISASNRSTGFTVQATAMVISMLPIMCVYPFLQKYFVQGLMLGSVKE